MESIALVGRTWTQLPEFCDPSALRDLILRDSKFFDLEQLRGCTSLTDIWIDACDDLRNLSVLEGLKYLDTVTLEQIRSNEDWLDLLPVRAKNLWLSTPATHRPTHAVHRTLADRGWRLPDDTFEDDVIARFGFVEVLELNKIEGAPAEPGAIVQVTRLGSVADSLNRYGSQLSITGLQLEDKVRELVRNARPVIAESDVEYDSETEMTSVVFAKREDAISVAKQLSAWINAED